MGRKRRSPKVVVKFENPADEAKLGEKFMSIVWEMYKNSPRFLEDMKKIEEYKSLENHP